MAKAAPVVNPDSAKAAWATLSVAEQLALSDEKTRVEALVNLTEDALLDLLYDWHFWARPKQLAPPGDWSAWVVRAGRGFGKTRTGTGWVHERAMEHPHRWIALIGRTSEAAIFRILRFWRGGGRRSRPIPRSPGIWAAPLILHRLWVSRGFEHHPLALGDAAPHVHGVDEGRRDPPPCSP